MTLSKKNLLSDSSHNLNAFDLDRIFSDIEFVTNLANAKKVAIYAFFFIRIEKVGNLIGVKHLTIV